jgi:flagellar protein FliJ
MKLREHVLRLKRFEADEKRRKVEDLDMMLRDFDRMAVDLERQIEAEESRTGIRDKTHFSYSTFAKSACQRRDNLLASIADLVAKRDKAVVERDDAMLDLQRAQSDARDQADRSSLRAASVGASVR